MIEPITDMPEGTIGFRASGAVTRDDYRDVLEPALREAAMAGEVRMLYVVDSEFEMEPGALLEDAKTGIDLGIGHRGAWKRTAIVTDTDWVRRAVRMFAWMSPGEVRVWGLAGLAEAREWVAG
jgi:SpoIIAA-like